FVDLQPIGQCNYPGNTKHNSARPLRRKRFPQTPRTSVHQRGDLVYLSPSAARRYRSRAFCSRKCRNFWLRSATHRCSGTNAACEGKKTKSETRHPNQARMTKREHQRNLLVFHGIDLLKLNSNLLARPIIAEDKRHCKTWWL